LGNLTGSTDQRERGKERHDNRTLDQGSDEGAKKCIAKAKDSFVGALKKDSTFLFTGILVKNSLQFGLDNVHRDRGWTPFDVSGHF
jgi:hypothetical protein